MRHDSPTNSIAANDDMPGQQALSEAERNRKTGRVVLWMLISFFLLFAAVDALFVYLAVETHSGEVTSGD